MEDIVEDIEILRKRLLYQSHHRGMKEMDLLLGNFSQKFLGPMNEKELKQFEDLLAFPDQDLYGWFFERAVPPDGAPQKLIEMLDNFIKTL